MPRCRIEVYNVEVQSSPSKGNPHREVASLHLATSLPLLLSALYIVLDMFEKQTHKLMRTTEIRRPSHT